MKQIPIEKCCAVLTLLENGQSCHKIATQLQLGHSTVAEIHQQVTTPLPKASGGHPTKLTPYAHRCIVCLITSGQADNASQVKQKLQDPSPINISTQTICNALKKENLRAGVKSKKPLLCKCHIKACYDFAVKYQHWTEDDWFHVIFSDEMKINHMGSDGRVWVWKKAGAPITKQHVLPTVKFGGGSVMVWGCMTAHGIGFCCRIDGRMDGSLYREILEDHVFQTAEWYGVGREDFIFQQDGDPKHRSKLAQEWFKDNKVKVLDWPAQSPDLNPIEHLWWYLKRRLHSYPTDPKSIHELWERIEVEWERIPKEVCVDLIRSMPRRVAAVLKAKGGYTKY